MAPPQKAKVHGFFRQEESINTIYQIIPAAAASIAANLLLSAFVIIAPLPASDTSDKAVTLLVV